MTSPVTVTPPVTTVTPYRGGYVTLRSGGGVTVTENYGYVTSYNTHNPLKAFKNLLRLGTFEHHGGRVEERRGDTPKKGVNQVTGTYVKCAPLPQPLQSPPEARLRPLQA